MSTDIITPNRVRHATSNEAYDDVRKVVSQDGTWGREVHDSTALAIASWWQSPGSIGYVLASLASGHPVSVEELLDDIHRTRCEAMDNGTLSRRDATALDCLAAWAMFSANYRAPEA